MSRISRFFSLIAAFNDAGVLRGIFGARSEANGNMVIVAGVDEQGMESDAANLPVQLDGSKIYLSGDGQYALEIPPPGLAAPHFLVLGQSYTGPDGATYSNLELGPEVPRELIEEFTDATDYSLSPQGSSEIVVAGVLANTFISTTTFHWECVCDNRGDRAADFIIQPLWKGAALGGPTTVTLSGANQLVSGNVAFTTPPAPGDAVSLRVTSDNWAHNSRPDPYVSGTIQPSRIVVYQQGTF